MKLDISRVIVWSCKLMDKPGTLAKKLNALTNAGANLDFLLVRRTQKGKGVVYVAPVAGPRQTRAAGQAGFAKDGAIAVLRVSGADRPGVGAAITETLGEAGLNIAGMSTTSSGRSFIAYVAFDSATEAAQARRLLLHL